VNRQAQAVVLLLVGGAILRASLTDLYTRYVKVGLQPFLVVAGIILIAAAVVTLWYELRPRKPHGAYAATHDGDAHEPDDGHGHVHEPRVAWFLVLPVFALLLVAPPALGSYAANRSGISLQQVSDFPALPAGDPVKISVIDYATRAVFDDGKSLKGRKIKLSGFVMIAHDGAPYLARMVLSCCAADARPVKLGMTGGVPPGAKADSWLEIVGQYTDKTTKDDVNQAVIPYIEVIEAHSIEAPSNHYDS
jgi:putative membrane protein